MMQNKAHYYFILIVLLLVQSCTDPAKEALKQSFENIKLPQEQFTLSGEESQVFETKYGSVLSVPKGAFLDENGNVWNGTVNLGLTEVQNPLEMAENHLTSVSEDGLLKSHKVIQLIPTTKDGKTLEINPENAPYIEFPVGDTDKELNVYEGRKDKYGAVKWEKSEPSPKFLIALSFDELDFYPDGFEEIVEREIPYKTYQVATKSLKDSLFYALHELLNKNQEPDSVSVELKNFRYSKPEESPYKLTRQDTDGNPRSNSFICTGIDPAIVKTIKNKRFENTFLATREFAHRLKALYKTCDNANLELYINNLNKNLWEIDQQVANRLGEGHAQYEAFVSFAKEKLTGVKGGEKHAQALQSFYAKQLTKNRQEIEKTAKAYREELARQEANFQSAQKKHREKLEKLTTQYKKVFD